MRRELRSFEIACDWCDTAVTVTTIGSGIPSLPPGWGTVAIHDCGMTGYTRYDDVCPRCHQTYQEHQQEERESA